MGKGWLGALLFSIVVSTIFGEVFSYTSGMSLWIGFAAFLAILLFAFGIIVRLSRRRHTERGGELLELRQLLAKDLTDTEDTQSAER